MSAASPRRLLVDSAQAGGQPRPARASVQPGSDDDAGAVTAPARSAQQLAAVTAPGGTAWVADVAGPDSVGHLPARDDAGARPPRLRVEVSPAVTAGVVFAVCGVLAAATVQHTLASFAQEGGVSPVIFLAVPGLFAALFAILVYQGARQKVTRMAQSFSRALLVALLTWAAFSALATSVWCKPEHYGQCYSSFLIVSGLIGGGPMLIAAGVAGALVGWLILQQRG